MAAQPGRLAKAPPKQMGYSLKVYIGDSMQGTIIGLIKGDTGSLDYSSNEH